MTTLSTILGNPENFYVKTCARLSSLEIDVSELPLSHLAFRTRTHREYLSVRDVLEQHAIASLENVWNDRPISKILLKKPLALAPQASVDLIELIPPFHKSIYPMGLEHVGFVLDDEFAGFYQQHRAALTGQQYHSEVCEPYVVRFEDYTHAKFYRYSMQEVCKREGQQLEGIVHTDWVASNPDAGPYETPSG